MQNNAIKLKSRSSFTISPKDNEYTPNCRELFFGISEKERRAEKELCREKLADKAKRELFGMAVGGIILAFLVITLLFLTI